MAGIQGFSNNNTATSTTYYSPQRRTTTTTGNALTQVKTRQQLLTRNNSNQQENHHDQMWRYSSREQPSTLDQELERRNLQKLSFNENTNQLGGDEYEHEQDGENNKLSRHNLSKNSSSEDEGGGGEILRPNKLFPVLSERDELLRKVRSVLNKVSSVNYTRLRKRWLGLMPMGVGEEEQAEHHHQGVEKEEAPCRISVSQIGEVLRMVLSKALDDTIYMNIYAGLLGYVVARKPGDISSKIRSLINSQLQSELKKLTTDKELALFHRSTQRVDLTRRKKVTLYRFIAELYCEKACTSRFLYERVTDLLIVNNPVDIDENVECLCVLMTFAGSKLEQTKKQWVEDIFKKLIQRQNETPVTISKRISFMILDLVEMKSSGWSPHNKWWSHSVQRAPERERTHSSPSPSSTNNRSSLQSQSHHRHQEMVPLHHQEDLAVGNVNHIESNKSKKVIFQRNSNSPLRSRTLSEGSSNNGNVRGESHYPSTSSSSTTKVKNISVPPPSSFQLHKTYRANKPGEIQQTQQQQQHQKQQGQQQQHDHQNRNSSSSNSNSKTRRGKKGQQQMPPFKATTSRSEWGLDWRGRPPSLE